MSRLSICLLTLSVGLTAPSVRAQSAAAVPSEATLDRLHLTQAWRAVVPIDGKADGIALAQLFDEQLFVQTSSGWLAAINTRTGEVAWRQRLEESYSNVFPIAVNSRLVLAVNGTRLYAFERNYGEPIFVAILPTAPLQGPTADEERVLISLGNNRIVNYLLPRLTPLPDDRFKIPEKAKTYDGRKRIDLSATVVDDERRSPTVINPTPSDSNSTVNSRTPSLAVVPSLRPPYSLNNSRSPSLATVQTTRPPYILDSNRTPSLTNINSFGRLNILTDSLTFGVQPTILWDYPSPGRLQGLPTGTKDFFISATSDRALVTFYKTRPLEKSIVFSYLRMPAEIVSELTLIDNVAYFATGDSKVYAYRVDLARRMWLYNGRGMLNRKPLVTNDAVYVAGPQAGVMAIRSDFGEPLWRQPVQKVDRILAVGPKYIYGLSREGELVVLDRSNGNELAGLDVSAFTVPIVNEQDDRLFLAARDGLILCLRDQNVKTPVRLIPQKEAEPKMPDPKEPKTPAMPKTPDVAAD